MAEDFSERLPRPADTSADETADLEKTGQPDWMRRLKPSRLPRAQRRVLRWIIAAAVVLVLIGLFYFALGPSFGLPAAKHTYSVDGDIWNDVAPLPSGFPTDIGWEGPYKTGKPAEFAEEMVPVASPTRGASPIQTSLPGFGAKFNPFQHMGPLSPYQSGQFGSVDNAKYLATPHTSRGKCILQQVHILHRHGARYPTKGSPTEQVRDFITPKGGVRQVNFSGPLEFMNEYEYRLGEELLVALGRNQLHSSGVKAAIDYGELVQADVEAGKPMFVRAGSQQRIVDSAIAWMTGFHGNAWSNKTNFEIQIETPGFNTTLASNFACSAAHKKRTALESAEKFLRGATERLQVHVHGAKLTPDVVLGMQQLCSYDTVAFGRSDFCALFTEEEWRGVESMWDFKFHNYDGASSPTGPAKGLGWLNEFISRLTTTPWNATTQTSENTTLNSQERFFPLDRALYADFAHDTSMSRSAGCTDRSHHRRARGNAPQRL